MYLKSAQIQLVLASVLIVFTLVGLSSFAKGKGILCKVLLEGKISGIEVFNNQGLSPSDLTLRDFMHTVVFDRQTAATISNRIYQNLEVHPSIGIGEVVQSLGERGMNAIGFYTRIGGEHINAKLRGFEPMTELFRFHLKFQIVTQIIREPI